MHILKTNLLKVFIFLLDQAQIQLVFKHLPHYSAQLALIYQISESTRACSRITHVKNTLDVFLCNLKVVFIWVPLQTRDASRALG